MDDIVSEQHKMLSRELKKIVAVYKESRDLVLMGGYSKGQDKSIDVAQQLWPKIVEFMKQDSSEKDTFDGSYEKLKILLENTVQMLNKKRLKNLLSLKQKELFNQKIEISTLDNEFRKNKNNKKKLKEILENTLIENTETAFDIKEKSQYKIKLTEQMYISDNRERFLNIELIRAKKNLGKLIKEKDLVNRKIEMVSKLESNEKENNFINSMPPPKNS